MFDTTLGIMLHVSEDNTRPHQINFRGPSLLLLDAVEMSATVFFSNWKV